MKIYVTEYKTNHISDLLESRYYIEFAREFLGAKYKFTLPSFKPMKKLSRKMVWKIMSSPENTLHRFNLRLNYNSVTSFRSYYYEYKDKLR